MDVCGGAGTETVLRKTINSALIPKLMQQMKTEIGFQQTPTLKLLKIHSKLKKTNPTSHWGKRSLTSGNNATILFILLCPFSNYNRVINNQKPYLITPMIKLSSG
jgi:hypothetical protein